MSFASGAIVVCARCSSRGELACEAQAKGWALFTFAWQERGPAPFGLCPACAEAFRSFMAATPLVDELQPGR